jgi:5-methylthioribose kinase
LLGYDPEQHVLAMEDLSHLTAWRTALNAGSVATDAIAQCGRHVARLLFHTGTLTMTSQAHREAVARSTNRALCAISEALVFEEPFTEHPNNSYVAALRSPIRSLHADVALRRVVGRLERCFTTRAEALVHGDLHTGSVMVGENAVGCPVTKVIDPEFCFYGPIAFDLGTLLANVMFARARASCCGNDAQRRWLDGLQAELWRAFTAELWTLWPRRASRSTTEEHLATWLDEVARDALGFAGCEAVRRVIGFAKVTDIESLPAELHVAAATEVLTTARGWLAASAAAAATGRPPAEFSAATNWVATSP